VVRDAHHFVGGVVILWLDVPVVTSMAIRLRWEAEVLSCNEGF
jgi:hypothetical protein